MKIKNYKPNKLNMIIATLLGLPGVVYIMTCFVANRVMENLRK